MIHIGFTGTQRGMTSAQGDRLVLFLQDQPQFILHHGGCVGADIEAHVAAKVFTHNLCAGIMIHPGNIPAMSGVGVLLLWPGIDHMLAPKPPLDRNHDIVDASRFMIATPKEDRPVTRSGTWATIRYAQKQEKTTYIILPNGTLVEN